MSAISMKLSTTAVLLGVLLLAQGPVSKPVTGQNLEDVLQAMVGLTTDPLLPADTPPPIGSR